MSQSGAEAVISFVDAHPAPEVKGQFSPLAACSRASAGIVVPFVRASNSPICMPIKKGSKNKKPKLSRLNVKTSVAGQAQTIVELRQQLAGSLQRESATAKELQDYKRQFTEALEQQSASSEILDVIASSPNDLTPVLETVAKNAAQLCEANSAQVFRTEGQFLRLAANYGELPAGDMRPISRGTVTGRAVIEQKTIHANDPVQSAGEFPDSRTAGKQARLATPLLRDGIVLGVIGIRRTDMRPFTESQIRLVETFAKQAVIATRRTSPSSRRM